mgnify:CR=1 FL=1
MTSISKPLILDLGCGNKKRKDAVGVDLNASTNPDIVHNLNKFPYPFESSSVDKIIMDNTLEHLQDIIAVMEELYRIVKPGGSVKIITPYFRSVWAIIDPTHLHYFTTNSFAYYDANHIICKRYQYTHARFNTIKIVFNEPIKSDPIKTLLRSFANKWPWFYEYRLSHFSPLTK